MHGKVWMFSHLIDDEDIEFMQHEFISYRQAMDYYNLGYKPIVRLSHKAGAVYKIKKHPHFSMHLKRFPPLKHCHLIFHEIVQDIHQRFLCLSTSRNRI